MEDLVRYMIEGLVDNPDEIRVAAVEGPRQVTYEVSVAEGDLGKVIGRGGRIANALRTIVKAVPASDGRRHSVEIVS